MTLRRSVLASLALIALPGVATAQAQLALPPAISVTGEATISVTPDLATIVIDTIRTAERQHRPELPD